MENTLYVALTRQMAMRQKMTVLANNIANVSTAGYKGEQLLFVEYLTKQAGGETLSLVQDLSVIRDYGQGPLTKTGNSLDVALHGPGWFVVDTQLGEFYTRDGTFQIDKDGRLVTSRSEVVLGEDGEPITFKAGETQIQISSDGTVSTSAGRKGRLKVVMLPDENLLKKAGNNLYSTEATPEPATDATVVQGMVETSNVQPILEVTKMIEALRSYQAAQKIIESELNRETDTIKILTDQN